MSSSDVEKAFMALTKATQSVHVFAEVKVAKVKVIIKILMFEALSESSALGRTIGFPQGGCYLVLTH